MYHHEKKTTIENIIMSIRNIKSSTKYPHPNAHTRGNEIFKTAPVIVLLRTRQHHLRSAHLVCVSWSTWRGCFPTCLSTSVLGHRLRAAVLIVRGERSFWLLGRWCRGARPWASKRNQCPAPNAHTPVPSNVCSASTTYKVRARGLGTEFSLGCVWSFKSSREILLGV